MQEQHFEVVVIGGGAAGLSGAVTLARARRTVLVIDAGAPRNAPAEGVHSYLTRDGMPPGEFTAAGRAEVRGYGGEVWEDGVDTVKRDGDRFAVRLDGGRAVSADRLLVATGAVDHLPQIPGLAERWGREVLHCPYCHGWEVQDRRIAILATDPAVAMHQALLWRQWSDAVTVLRHTAGAFAADDEERLAARGIDLVEGEVTAVEVEDDRLAAVVLASGRRVACAALVVGTAPDAAAPFLADLGLEAVEARPGEPAFGTKVETDPTGKTSVPGVWVAGNVANPMAQVVASAAGGTMAGAMINMDLVEAETARAVSARRRELTL
ncbi:NAD(P)/FAD-dependent oxidoreductase [Glycomyces buryatensis]|uniref:NAD(P)/FAD-dependent oxidoreductase n=1 Tax=Glycomyces buryatensis TaxID=2570927 RepID=A0A4S8PQR5_9ACTN|nr:NAD(P)/FAD-dependent oxidoreductase [Glycomyces buryatensis]THV33457.1 NAD(P)/FAD-dependent oxidoreductase [Glycomyces buryatensis]